MGNIEYEHLPRYIAVQLSMYRWAIATLRGNAEWGTPNYVITSDKMTKSQCHDTLCHLQTNRESVDNG